VGVVVAAGQYCMPEEGTQLTPQTHVLSSAEVERLTQLFCSQGVTKVRLTGGEPLVRKDLVDVVSKSGSAGWVCLRLQC